MVLSRSLRAVALTSASQARRTLMLSAMAPFDERARFVSVPTTVGRMARRVTWSCSGTGREDGGITPRGMEEKLCSSEHGRTHRQEVTIALSMAAKSCIGRLALKTTSPALQELWEDFFFKKNPEMGTRSCLINVHLLIPSVMLLKNLVSETVWRT